MSLTRMKDLSDEMVEMSKGVWSTAKVNQLPDSAFLHIEAGGEKDENGHTMPRTLRHFPFKNEEGEIDLPHLRNALARISQSNLSEEVRENVQKRAEKLLAGEKEE